MLDIGARPVKLASGGGVSPPDLPTPLSHSEPGVKEHKRLLYHLTDNRNFKLDPAYKPCGATPGTHMASPMLFATDDPMFWDAVFQGKRQYVAEIEIVENDEGVRLPTYVDEWNGIPQTMIFDLRKAKVRRVMSLSEYRPKATLSEYKKVLLDEIADLAENDGRKRSFSIVAVQEILDRRDPP